MEAVSVAFPLLIFREAPYRGPVREKPGFEVGILAYINKIVESKNNIPIGLFYLVKNKAI